MTEANVMFLPLPYRPLVKKTNYEFFSGIFRIVLTFFSSILR